MFWWGRGESIARASEPAQPGVLDSHRTMQKLVQLRRGWGSAPHPLSYPVHKAS